MNRTKFILLTLLILCCLGSLSAELTSGANHNFEIYNRKLSTPRPRYAADLIKIKLTEDANRLANLPTGLYEEDYSFNINELDQLFSVSGGQKIIRAHRRLKDIAWEKETGFNRWFLIKLDGSVSVEQAIKNFKANRYIEEAIPEFYAYTTAVPNDTYYANNWGHNNTAQLPVYSGGSHSGAGVGTIGYDADMQLAWDQSQGYGSATTIIAIIDTGVDTSHPDLRLVTGYDYGDNDSNPMDNSADPGHGTSCSGVAAGRANNALGVAGVAGGCSVMPLKIASSDGSLGFTAIENALTHTGDNNVDVASMSFGAEGGMVEGDSPSTDTALEYAYSHGVTLLAATANSNASAIAYPSNHNKVISVGASSPTGQRKSTTSSDGENWWGSNYGTAVQDASLAVDIMAPTILPATDLMGTAGYNTSSSPTGDYYMWFNGTSCATPYAAGVAALIISKVPTLTPAQVRQALVSTCTDMTVDGGVGWDRYTGYGMVNANSALLSVTPGMPSCTITAPLDGSAFDLNSTITVNVTATDTDGTISNVKFYIDDVLKSTDSTSPYSWNWNTTGYSGGNHIIKAIATDNANNTANSTVTVNLLAPADEGFETGNFSAYPWVNSSAIPWTVQSSEKYSGTYAARSGAIGDNANTELSISLNITSPGNISFYQKVSSETGYDFLRFFIDDVQQGEWSGSGSWTQQSYAVTVGSHTFLWRYLKDVNTVSGSDCAWIDHINFPAYNNFYAPTNLVANNSSGTVTLSWSPPSGNTPSSYNLYRDSALLYNTTSTGYVDISVIIGVSYSYYVTAVYSSPSGESGSSNTVTITPSNTAVVTVGTGTLEGNHLPVEPYYKYTFSQSIFLQSEINLSNHKITKIAWRYNGFQSWTDAIVIYMGHTNLSAFASTSSWVPLSSLTQVYSGGLAVTTTAGWVELTLSTPFLYNGTQNLVIAVDENTNGYHYDGSEFYTSSVSGNRSIYYYSDTTNPNPSSPPTTGTYLGINSFVPNTTLTLLPQSPLISVNPTSLAYGTVRINTSAANTFQISNSGVATLSGTITTPAVYTVALSRQGEAFSDGKASLNTKSEETRNSLAYSIPAGSSSTFSVSFTPTAVQAYNGNITITHNAGGADKTIALTGQGGKPTLALSSTSFTANLGLNGTGSDNLALSNTGNLQLSYNLAIAGSVPWLSLNGGTSASGTIAVGGAAQNVSLSYNAAGLDPGYYNATIDGSSNDPSAATFSLSVTLNVLAPLIQVSPLEINFGQVSVNTTATQNFTLSNPGTATLIGQINTTPMLSVAEARIGEIRETHLLQASSETLNDRNTLVYSVPAGESRTFTVSFTPTQLIDYDELITITHNAEGSQIQIEVSGIGTQAILQWQPTSITVDLPYAGSTLESLDLGNIGNIPLNFSASRATGSFPFTINGSSSVSGNIDPYEIYGLQIGFIAPTEAGTYNGAIDINSNDPDNPFVRISVTMNVYNPNHPPVFNLPDMVDVPYNGSRQFSFLAYAADQDDDVLDVLEIITGGHISYISGRLTPNPNWHGQESIQVTITDGEFQVTDEMLVIVNGPPVLNIPSDFSFNRNDYLMVDFRDFITDSDDNIFTLSFSGNSAVNINTNNAMVMFSAPNGFAGSETITISVTDGHNTVQDSFTVNVINHAPVLNLPTDFSLDQNGSLTVDFSPYISDADFDFPILSNSGNSNVGVSIDGYSVTFTPIAGWFGSEQIVFTLSDGLLQTFAVVQVTVNQVISHLDTPELIISASINGIFITWQPINYATEYQVYRASEPNGSYSLIATTSNTMYYDNNPPHKAFYYVKAVYMPLSK